MEITGTSIQPLGNAPLGRAIQPVSETNGQMPAGRDRQDPVPTRETPVSARRAKAPITATRIEPRIGTSTAQYAIEAYTATERSEELEYVSTVLGIDEYA